ncbi:hypothetical protein [Nocardia sp. R6R-6]|uniref:hypothetical protein n=1 Tax=Nocardia sp. R6R-6 TaxID=3459303 RepID=UPI00403E05B9
MKKFVVVAAITAGLVASTGSAMAQPASAAAPPATVVVGSSSADVFCAVIKFLKGGWAGRVTDCSF